MVPFKKLYYWTWLLAYEIRMVFLYLTLYPETLINYVNRYKSLSVFSSGFSKDINHLVCEYWHFCFFFNPYTYFLVFPIWFSFMEFCSLCASSLCTGDGIWKVIWKATLRPRRIISFSIFKFLFVSFMGLGALIVQDNFD